jgi:hypothetical protein
MQLQNKTNIQKKKKKKKKKSEKKNEAGPTRLESTAVEEASSRTFARFGSDGLLRQVLLDSKQQTVLLLFFLHFRQLFFAAPFLRTLHSLPPRKI